MSLDVFAETRDWALDRGLKLWAMSEAGSTNTIAKDDEEAATKPLLSPGEHASPPTLYIVRNQTQGRGRGTHTWTMPEGSSLLSSWSFAVEKVPQPVFSALAGLALYEAAKAAWPTVAFNLKAPNDLFIDRRKTAGILIETVDSGTHKRTVVGVGLNVAAKPPLETATCLAEHLDSPVDGRAWRSFLQAWVDRVMPALVSGQRAMLSQDACERLKEALNRHPLLKSPIDHVDEYGQLHSALGLVRWQDL